MAGTVGQRGSLLRLVPALALVLVLAVLAQLPDPTASTAAENPASLADWLTYSGSQQEWFGDGTHVGPTGAWALSDYISRSIAAVEHRPCPRPWVPSATVTSPCPQPELVGPAPDPRGLY